MNECTAWRLRADQPPARQGGSPATVDHGWRCTTRRAAGVDDGTGLTVAGVAEVDVGAVDVSRRRIASIGPRC